MDIVLYPDPILWEKTEPIAEIDSEIEKLAEEMIATMHRANGVGLAGPQVGIKKQIVVISPTGEPGDDSVYIDPKIIKSKGWEEDTEGCLSLPNIYGTVARAKWIEVSATLLSGEQVVFEAEGFRARVLQHDIDHLEGVLFITKIQPIEEVTIRSQLREMEKRYREEKKS